LIDYERTGSSAQFGRILDDITQQTKVYYPLDVEMLVIISGFADWAVNLTPNLVQYAWLRGSLEIDGRWGDAIQTDRGVNVSLFEQLAVDIGSVQLTRLAGLLLNASFPASLTCEIDDFEFGNAPVAQACVWEKAQRPLAYSCGCMWIETTRDSDLELELTNFVRETSQVAEYSVLHTRHLAQYMKRFGSFAATSFGRVFMHNDEEVIFEEQYNLLETDTKIMLFNDIVPVENDFIAFSDEMHSIYQQDAIAVAHAYLVGILQSNPDFFGQWRVGNSTGLSHLVPYPVRMETALQDRTVSGDLLLNSLWDMDSQYSLLGGVDGLNAWVEVCSKFEDLPSLLEAQINLLAESIGEEEIKEGFDAENGHLFCAWVVEKIPYILPYSWTSQSIHQDGPRINIDIHNLDFVTSSFNDDISDVEIFELGKLLWEPQSKLSVTNASGVEQWQFMQGNSNTSSIEYLQFTQMVNSLLANKTYVEFEAVDMQHVSNLVVESTFSLASRLYKVIFDVFGHGNTSVMNRVNLEKWTVAANVDSLASELREATRLETLDRDSLLKMMQWAKSWYITTGNEVQNSLPSSVSEDARDWVDLAALQWSRVAITGACKDLQELYCYVENAEVRTGWDDMPLFDKTFPDAVAVETFKAVFTDVDNSVAKIVGAVIPDKTAWYEVNLLYLIRAYRTFFDKENFNVQSILTEGAATPAYSEWVKGNGADALASLLSQNNGKCRSVTRPYGAIDCEIFSNLIQYFYHVSVDVVWAEVLSTQGDSSVEKGIFTTCTARELLLDGHRDVLMEKQGSGYLPFIRGFSSHILYSAELVPPLLSSYGGSESLNNVEAESISAWENYVLPSNTDNQNLAAEKLFRMSMTQTLGNLDTREWMKILAIEGEVTTERYGNELSIAGSDGYHTFPSLDMHDGSMPPTQIDVWSTRNTRPVAMFWEQNVGQTSYEDGVSLHRYVASPESLSRYPADEEIPMSCLRTVTDQHPIPLLVGFPHFHFCDEPLGDDGEGLIFSFGKDKRFSAVINKSDGIPEADEFNTMLVDSVTGVTFESNFCTTTYLDMPKNNFLYRSMPATVTPHLTECLLSRIPRARAEEYAEYIDATRLEFSVVAGFLDFITFVLGFIFVFIGVFGTMYQRRKRSMLKNPEILYEERLQAKADELFETNLAKEHALEEKLKEDERLIRIKKEEAKVKAAKEEANQRHEKMAFLEDLDSGSDSDGDLDGDPYGDNGR
jgi:hypothetical protein